MAIYHEKFTDKVIGFFIHKVNHSEAYAFIYADNEKQAEKTMAFIEANPELKDLVPEALGQIRNYFCYDSLSVHLFEDPDEPIVADMLVLNIVLDCEVQEARKRMDAFTEDWWRHNWCRADGLLCIKPKFKN